MTMSRLRRIRAAVIVRFPVASPACTGMPPTSLEHATPRDRAGLAPHLTLLCNAVQARIANRFEQVASQCRYIVHAKLSRTMDDNGTVIVPVRVGFMPITAAQAGRIPPVREPLQPTPASSSYPLGAPFTRLELGERANTVRPREERRPSPRPSEPTTARRERGSSRGGRRP